MSVESIREAERKSHEEVYSTAKLFEKGSWLQKPVKTVLDILPLFDGYEELNVLDLGCGVGRNSIPIAQVFKKAKCKIDCVDILELAIKKLTEYSSHYGVSYSINGIVSSINDFEISRDLYDFILAVSALEHTDSEESFKNKLSEISNGVKLDGVVCLIVNSEVIEKNKENGQPVLPQFEVNLKTDELLSILEKEFSGWQVLKSTVVSQNYDIPRNGFVSELSTKVVTFAARKQQ